jgi:redox-sensitive bicupin YhaK (pirin superfamily)
MNRKLKRLQSPRHGIQYIINSEVREELSPFVFFDAGTMVRNDDGLIIGLHPHSGIGIITYFEGGNLKHSDTEKNDGIINDGGVQWISAGSGIFHEENYLKADSNNNDSWPLSIYQLWLQLPPESEDNLPEYKGIQPDDLIVLDNVKILVGSYNGLKSPLEVPFNMTYLAVKLKAGETFEYATPDKQTTGFIFPTNGLMELHGDAIELNNLNILEENEGLIKIKASSNSKFILILAEPQSYPIVSYGGSIHTSEDSLRKSSDRISQIKKIYKRTKKSEMTEK